MGKNKTVVILVVLCVAGCACVLCMGGGAYVVSDSSLVQIDQLDDYQFTSTPMVVMDLPATMPPPPPPTATPIPSTAAPSTPTAAPAPSSTPLPTATPIVLNLEQVQAMTEVGFEDFTPFFAEISRQEWDDEITDAQADEKREKLRSIFQGKRLRDTGVTINDASFYDYSDEDECQLRTTADHQYSIGHRWVDSTYDENKVWVEIPGSTAEYCRAFQIGQHVTVSGELEFSSYGSVTLINATVQP